MVVIEVLTVKKFAKKFRKAENTIVFSEVTYDRSVTLKSEKGKIGRKQ